MAPEALPLLLIDHANCEKKAASTALNMMYRYVNQPALMQQLSKLAREELRHFEQVLEVMQKRDITYVHVTPSQYAGELRKSVRTWEPGRLIDMLIVGAIVEARSCERFGRLTSVLDEELAAFYASLQAAEARHFLVYLDFARSMSADIDDRIDQFLTIERRLIEASDTEFRFLSGIPDRSVAPAISN